MAQKCEGPRGNAGPNTKTNNSQRNAVDQALATSIWENIEGQGRVRLAALRARVRDWCTRADLVRALVALITARAVVISGSLDGPVIEVAQRRGAR